MELASSSRPEHRAFLSRLVRELSQDVRFVAVLAAGSYVQNRLDEFSDLDLVLVVEPSRYAEVMGERKALAGSFGHLLEAFTGEHVGEPRLLICLYDSPLLHVDLKFVPPEALAARVEDPAVLWERGGRATAALAAGVANYPAPDPRWLAERFWVWVHYAATKIGRGELFEALSMLDYLRGHVLGPLGLARAGARPNGVRHVESASPELAARLEQTVARYDAADCLRALRACVGTYRWLAPGPHPAEAPVVRYLEQVEAQRVR